MRLLLFHPGVASFTCEQCEKYIYDFDTGKQKTFKAGAERKEQPYLRPPNVATPCQKCPRESPEKAHEYELSDRNYRTLILYRRAKATMFHYLTEAEKTDPLVARNFAALDVLFAEHERQKQITTLVHELSPFLVKSNG